MNLQLNNKTALVSGSTAGIGFATARSLALEGAAVIVNGRSDTRVRAAIDQIKAETGNENVRGAVADFSNAVQVSDLLQEFPNVDILINNVGIAEAKEFEAISDEDWMRIFELNVLSGVRLSRAYLANMLRKNWGRIIFISSESAVQVPPEMIHYGVSKTAQLSLSRGLAELTVGSGVTVNTILPGPTSTEAIVQFMKAIAQQKGITDAEMENEFFNTMRGTSLLKRFITPEEIANMVTFIASPLSSATNGATLRADGGVIKSAF